MDCPTGLKTVCTGMYVRVRSSHTVGETPDGSESPAPTATRRSSRLGTSEALRPSQTSLLPAPLPPRDGSLEFIFPLSHSFYSLVFCPAGGHIPQAG